MKKFLLLSIFMCLLMLSIFCSDGDKKEKDLSDNDVGLSDILLQDSATLSDKLDYETGSELSYGDDLNDIILEDANMDSIDNDIVGQDTSVDVEDYYDGYDDILDADAGNIFDSEFSDDGGSSERIKIMTIGGEHNEEGTGVYSIGDEVYITGISYSSDYSDSDMLIGLLNEKTNTAYFNYSEFDMSFGIELQDGIIYTGGYVGSSGSFSGFFGLFDSYLKPIKQHIYNIQNKDLQFFAFKKYNSSTYILAGFVSGADNDAAIYIVNSDGQVEKSLILAKNNDQEFYAIDVDSEGNIIAAGIDVVDTNNWVDVYVVKFTKDLDVLWEKRFGSKEMDGANDVKVLPDGDILVSGYTEKNKNKTGKDGYAILLDTNGNLKGEKVFEINDDDEIRAAIYDKEGKIIFVMVENIYSPFSVIGDAVIVKTDKNFNILDGEAVSPDSSVNKIIPYNQGYLIIGTYYDPPPGQGDSDILLIVVKDF